MKVKNDSNVTIASYTYGDSNKRLIAQNGDENSNYRTYYVSEGSATIAEYTETPSLPTTPQWSKSYVYLGNRLLSTLTPNGGGEAVECHYPDRLGTRIITNPSTGTWSEQVTLPFGTALGAESSGTPSKRRFTSYDRSDVTKLDYAVNRHYDSQQGRFTQVDPAGMKATTPLNPQTLNLYAYCANDPINRTDADGLGLISFFKKVLGVISRIIKILTIVLIVVVAVAAVILFAVPALAALGNLLMYTLAPILGAITGTRLGSKAPAYSGGWYNIPGVPGPGSYGLGFQDPGGRAYNPGDVPGLTGPCPDGACIVNGLPDVASPSIFSRIWSGARKVVGGIAVATALSYMYYRQYDAWVGRQMERIERRMAENSRLAVIGHYPNGQPIYFGGTGASTVNVFSGELSEAAALTNAQRWLGPGYTEISPGVFRSADNLRQFRMTTSDLLDPAQGAHVHFESIAPDGPTIMENGHVRLRP